MKIVIEKIEKYRNEEKYNEALEVIRVTDPERYERICRNKSEENRYRLMSAGMLIKDVCDKMGIENPTVMHDEHGKPYIEGHPECYFNLSHSGKLVVMAYGDKPVGIDIQETRNVTESFGKRILNESEYDAYEMTDPKTMCFVWTIKEAYSKLIGLGLSYDFRNCVIDLTGKTITDTTGTFATAKFRHFKPDTGSFMTYAVFLEDTEKE